MIASLESGNSQTPIAPTNEAAAYRRRQAQP
jgi:hypothetical protein